METEKRSMESTISTLRSRARSALMDRDLAHNQVTSVEAVAQKHLDDIASLNKTVSGLREAIASGKMQVANLEARLSQSITKEEHLRIVDDLSGKIDELLSDGLDARNIRTDLECERKSLGESNKNLKEKLEAKSKRVAVLEDEITSLNASIACKQRRIDSLDSELNLMRKSCEQERESLESSHAIALALAEQSAAGALSRASVTQSALEVTQQRLADLLRENESLRKDALKPRICSSVQTSQGDWATVSIQTEAMNRGVHESCSTQTESTMLSTAVQTETIANAVEEICKCSKCKAPSHQFSLFPCGHGLCVACCELLVIADEVSLGGIVCEQCEDRLPVTRIVRNRPLEQIIRELFNLP